MAINQTLTTSFKAELFSGYHAFSSLYRTADTFMAALYASTAQLDYTVTAYTTTNEITASGYTAGGLAVTPTVISTSGTSAYLSFLNLSWPGSNIIAAGALIYNSSQNNRSVCVLAFGSNKTSINQVFTIQFPLAAPSTALLGIT